MRATGATPPSARACSRWCSNFPRETLLNWARRARPRDRKSTRLNSSHITTSYAVFCLKKKNKGGVPPVGRDIGDYTVCDPRFVATQSWNPIRRKPIFRLAVEVQAAPIRTEAGRPFTRRMIRNAQGLATFQLHEVDIRVLAGLFFFQ